MEEVAEECGCKCHHLNNNLTCIYPRTGEILYCCRKHKRDAGAQPKRNSKNRPSLHAAKEKKPYEQKIYIPRVMTDMMQATTANGTSIHFGFGHMCVEHNCLFDLKHI